MYFEITTRIAHVEGINGNSRFLSIQIICVLEPEGSDPKFCVYPEIPVA